MSRKPRIATLWLDGCSGCHMSLLDMDEGLLELAPRIELVYGPLVDAKRFPEDVDVTLVEGAVSSEEDMHRIREVRERSTIVVALGDCAVTGNVPAMRNAHSLQQVLDRAYVENVTGEGRVPEKAIPGLLTHVRPIQEVIKVDVHIPGCPPEAGIIFSSLAQLLDRRMPALAGHVRFG